MVSSFVFLTATRKRKLQSSVSEEVPPEELG